MTKQEETSPVEGQEIFQVLGTVEALTAGSGTGLADDPPNSQYKTAGGSVVPEFYDELPKL